MNWLYVFCGFFLTIKKKKKKKKMGDTWRKYYIRNGDCEYVIIKMEKIWLERERMGIC